MNGTIHMVEFVQSESFRFTNPVNEAKMIRSNRMTTKVYILATINKVVRIALITMLPIAATLNAGDCSRALRGLRGYTIEDYCSVMRVTKAERGGMVVLLSNGIAYSASMMWLEPLPMTDVVILSRRESKGETRPGLVKLLIDNEVYDAFSVRLR